MKNYLLALFAVVLLSAQCAAGTADTGAGSSLLWKISGNGLSQPSYLFGTIHMICPDEYLWTDAMKAALDKASSVCFEMDLDDPAMLQEAMAAMMGTKDEKSKSMDKSMSAKDYSRLRKVLKDSFDIDITSLASANPIVLQSLLLSKLLPCEQPAAYETRLMMTAMGSGKEIRGLESITEQMATLKSIEGDSSGGSLLQLVDSIGSARRMYAGMVAAYRRQDLSALYNFIIQSGEMKGRTATLLDDRNRKWIGRMRPMLQKESVFVAVGAGHLWGNAGVISLLRADGYTVTALR